MFACSSSSSLPKNKLELKKFGENALWGRGEGACDGLREYRYLHSPSQKYETLFY